MGELFNWGGESPEQRVIRNRMEMDALFEQAARMRMASQTAAAVAGGSVTAEIPLWISVTDTAYLYPKLDLDAAILETEVNFVRSGRRFIFESIEDVDQFYYDVFYQTSQSQPNGNPGYTLGVGTELEGSFEELYLELANGTRIITWQLMTQLTDQEDLPSGGDSPVGTIGYGAVYCDINGDGVPGLITDVNSGNIDPLRFQRTN